MKKLFVITILAFLLTACLGSAPTQTDVDILGTVVAGTLTAMPSATSTPEPTATEVIPTFTPEPAYVLPRSLYYLAKDASDNFQIYRLERDGVTVTQISDVDNGVSGFDISSVDGSIAFIAKNRLFISDSNGGNREPIAENSDTETLGMPIWFPDGKTILYRFGSDVVVYSIDTEKSEVLFSVSNKDDNYPASFSPDGSKLIVSKDRMMTIYDVRSGNMFSPDRYQAGFGNLNKVSWSSDSKYIFIFSPFAGGNGSGISIPGLWRYNVEDGTGGAVLPGEKDEIGNTQFGKDCVDAPIQDAEGRLVYLYARNDLICESPPLSIVRSASDGITGRVALRPETFNVEYSLWTPDASSLLIIQKNGENNANANMVLIPLDSSLPIVTILADASRLYSLRWGP